MGAITPSCLAFAMQALSGQAPLLLPTPSAPAMPPIPGQVPGESLPDPHTASIRGLLEDDLGKPLAGAFVTLIQRGRYVAGKEPGESSRVYPGISRELRTGPDGIYNAREHILCAPAETQETISEAANGAASRFMSR